MKAQKKTAHTYNVRTSGPNGGFLSDIRIKTASSILITFTFTNNLIKIGKIINT